MPRQVEQDGEPRGNGQKKDHRVDAVEDTTKIRYLDPRTIEVTRDAFNNLLLDVSPDEKHEKVRVSRAFPLSKPDQFISFSTHEGKEIGVVIEMKQMSAGSRRVVEEELALIYYSPEVTRVYSVEGKHGTTTWQVKTDRGDTTILIKDRGDIRRLPNRRILFTDVHGMKYDVPDYARLDEKSRSLIDGEV
jgi:hypothetical protein